MYNISKNNIKKLKINKNVIGFELKSDENLIFSPCLFDVFCSFSFLLSLRSA